MINAEKWKIFDEKIRSAGSILLCAHKNPDGDAICSVLALAHLIEMNYDKEVVCTYDGNIPDNLDEVPLRRKIRFFEKLDDDFAPDVAIVMDYGIERNIGGPHKFIERAKFVIEVDHHINDNKIGNLCFDDSDAAATAEIVYKMMRYAGWNSDLMTRCLLMTAIITDTGGFKYVKRGDILHIAAELVDSGVNIQRIVNDLANKPRKTIVTEATAVGATEFYYKNRLGVAIINSSQYKNLDGRGETVLNLLGQIRGLDYVALLKEQKPNQIGVSLRGRFKRVDHIASALGGGGHEFAAGAVVADTLENVKARILELFRKEIK